MDDDEDEQRGTNKKSSSEDFHQCTFFSLLRGKSTLRKTLAVKVVVVNLIAFSICGAGFCGVTAGKDN